ncbi:MAG: DNA adenine methylase [Chloroflexota bacterium]
MRYLGNKDSLLNFIDDVLMMHRAVSTPARPLTVCDPFTGTTSVARHLKRQDWRVISGDIMAYSYAFQHAYIALNDAPTFSGVINAGVVDPGIGPSVSIQLIFAHLNNLRGVEGFCYRNYSPDGVDGRRYFTSANALRIDAIRKEINWWSEMGWLTDGERYLLLAALIEAVSRVANVAGTYAAYLKGWDPRAHKPLMLNVPQIVHSAHDHSVNQADANELVPQQECNLLYIDPPYNSRQYATNYHLLETLALGDEPEIKGVAGLRAVNGKMSAYCKNGQAEESLSRLVCESHADWILMSYNNEGIIPHERVVEVLSQRGNVEVYACEYRRFRSDADSTTRTYKGNTVQEMLYWVKTSP